MLYLLSLQQGHTLEDKLIRTDCQRAYLRAAASWAVEAGLPSPVYSDSHQFPAPKAPLLPQLQKLIDNQKNWQGPKDRKEPLTPAMVIEMATLVASMSPDSDFAAMYDWSALGLSTGHRRVEYAQEKRSKFQVIHVQTEDNPVPTKQPYAFMEGDFQFLDEFRRPLRGTDRAFAAYVRIRWRTQKNRVNGETKMFARARDSRLCPVRAALRIQLRFERLQPPSRVLGVSDKGFLTASAITKFIRLTAARVLGPTATKEVLALYTPHSIRIGACVLLHEHGHSAIFIKNRLRWKSDTFMDYLRDTASLARKHAASLLSTLGFH